MFRKIKTFDSSLVTIVSNLTNGRVSIKIKKSLLVRKSSSSLYSNLQNLLAMLNKNQTRKRHLYISKSFLAHVIVSKTKNFYTQF